MADLEIEALLQKTLGLDISSIGEKSLDRAIERRARALGFDDRASYVDRLKNSVIELTELIEEIVIPETWFFRDSEPFAILNNYAKNQWAANHKEGVLRILSVPCSTGEEPYSLVMSLLRDGWPSSRLRIDACDISTRALERARQAVYRSNSFRGKTQDYREIYFNKVKDSYALKKEIKEKAHFHHGNLLNPIFMQSLGIFDVIFCRNVLIYLDEKSRKQVVKTLSQMLTQDGMLFVGHAETSLMSQSLFVPAPYPNAFAFFKKSSAKLPPLASLLKPKKQSPPAAAEKQKPAEKIEDKSNAELKEVLTLANKGQLQEAASLCEKHIDNNGPSPQAFYLLGIICDASGDPKKAENYLRKALYLKPDHRETLILLSFIAESSGDHMKAETFKQRISRIQ